jgi:hypothetical protein
MAGIQSMEINNAAPLSTKDSLSRRLSIPKRKVSVLLSFNARQLSGVPETRLHQVGTRKMSQNADAIARNILQARRAQQPADHLSAAAPSQSTMRSPLGSPAQAPGTNILSAASQARVLLETPSSIF